MIIKSTLSSIILANYLIEKTDCCTPAGENDPKCMPIYVPKDDPYLRHTGVRCMNLTRAQSFQEIGCITNDKPSATVCIFAIVKGSKIHISV